MSMTLLQVWFVICVIMSVRETSEDVYDPDYADSHVVRLLLVNLVMWHFWFVIDCIALVKREG